MKIRLLFITMFFCAVSFGQAPSLTFRVTDENEVLSRNVPVGSVLIDMDKKKQYLTLLPLPAPPTVTKLSECIIIRNDTDPLYASAHLKEINVNATTHQIGDLYLGGIIVSVWGDSGIEHGLIASVVDLGTTEWAGTYVNSVPEVVDNNTVILVADDFFDGKKNSDKVAATGDGTGAFYLCRNYDPDGSGGWYLPALWELYAIYHSTGIINQVLGSVNGLKANFYWSSTEGTTNPPGNAYALTFHGTTISQPDKISVYYVRAVKRF